MVSREEVEFNSIHVAEQSTRKGRRGERQKGNRDEEVGKGRKEGREGGRRTYFATKLNL
jgi:hypothetical protein